MRWMYGKDIEKEKWKLEKTKFNHPEQINLL